MDTWHFLDPWVRLLCPHTHLCSTQRPRDRGFSIAPCMGIKLKLASRPRFGSAVIARALELVALALRVDDCVWEKLRVLCDNTIDHGECWNVRPEDLAFRVQVGEENFGHEAYFQPHVVAADVDREGPMSVAAYLEAKRCIAALDIRGRLVGFQIPLAFSLRVQTELSVAQWVTMFENLLASGAVTTGAAAARGDTREAVYLLEDVAVESNCYPHSKYLRVFDDSVAQPGIHRLARLRELTVRITTFVGYAQIHSAFLGWMANDRALTLSISISGNAELRCILRSLLPTRARRGTRGVDTVVLRL